MPLDLSTFPDFDLLTQSYNDSPRVCSSVSALVFAPCVSCRPSTQQAAAAPLHFPATRARKTTSPAQQINASSLLLWINSFPAQEISHFLESVHFWTRTTYCLFQVRDPSTCHSGGRSPWNTSALLACSLGSLMQAVTKKICELHQCPPATRHPLCVSTITGTAEREGERAPSSDQSTQWRRVNKVLHTLYSDTSGM